MKKYLIFAIFCFLITVTSGLKQTNKTQNVIVNLAAVVGDKAFDCKETYEAIGTTNSKVSVTDFKFYVQNVRLVKLTNDGKFQTEKVAMLDFENCEGNCTNEILEYFS